ncbi:hypothetical protein [Cytobacillus gottheilii]|uniref:Ead/Ea22-like family protein n=1 Tax=Cytobacillus gottheilii TaxID=859144 RepID=A0ABX8FG00_9BACI|nr:hypothetical protein [Cytobacillus gottheilii]QVY62939.1 hypothetical protein J1899_07815 [Cytobacillus gottheilii]
MLTNEQLAEIKARANAATAGPWTQMNGVNIFTDLGATNKNGVTADRNDGWCIADTSEGLTFVDGELVEMESNEQWDNAKFIAHARQDIPNLIAEVERLRLALEDVADTGELYHEHWCRDIAREALRNASEEI